MTTLTITDLYGAVRGRGNPLAVTPPGDSDDEGILVSFSSREGWYEKTIKYRHDCMMNLAELNKQLQDPRPLSNRKLLEDRKAFLLSEINVCHRMLCMFTKEMN